MRKSMKQSMRKLRKNIGKMANSINQDIEDSLERHELGDHQLEGEAGIKIKKRVDFSLDSNEKSPQFSRAYNQGSEPAGAHELVHEYGIVQDQYNPYIDNHQTNINVNAYSDIREEPNEDSIMLDTRISDGQTKNLKQFMNDSNCLSQSQPDLVQSSSKRLQNKSKELLAKYRQAKSTKLDTLNVSEKVQLLPSLTNKLDSAQQSNLHIPSTLTAAGVYSPDSRHRTMTDNSNYKSMDLRYYQR